MFPKQRETSDRKTGLTRSRAAVASLVCVTAICGAVAVLAAGQLHTETRQSVFETVEAGPSLHHVGVAAEQTDVVFGQSCGTCHSGGTSLEIAGLGHAGATGHLLPLGDLHQSSVLRPVNGASSLSSCQTCHQGFEQARNETGDASDFIQLATLVGVAPGPWIE